MEEGANLTNYIETGNVLLRNKEYIKAIEYFQASIESLESVAEANLGLAEAYFAIDRDRQGKVALFKALALDPDNPRGMSLIQKHCFPNTSFPNKPAAAGKYSASGEYEVQGVRFKMVRVEGGTFTMGSPAGTGYDCEHPQHQVTLPDYWIGETEVTQEIWQAVMGNNPSYFKGNKLPVESVSWNDVQDFIMKLNRLTGQGFRLPTEAEWEYAARGGKEQDGYIYAGGSSLGDVGWYWQNSGDNFLHGTDDDWDLIAIQYNHCKTHPVAQKRPNALGLYDMSGNVWEWCSDWYGDDYYKNSPTYNPKGPNNGSSRVLRGGGCSINASSCRVAHRNGNYPGYRNYDLGFRLAF